MVVAEIKYRVCPRPFQRPREARRVRDWYGTGKGRASKGMGKGGGKGQVRDAYRTIKASKKFSGGWWWSEIKYSVCPRPFMRPREARWVRDRLRLGKGQVRDAYRTIKASKKFSGGWVVVVG